MIHRLLREPLLHFLLIGAALFAAHSWAVSRGGSSNATGDQVVRVTEQDVQWLAESWSRQRMRAPDADELRGLVNDYVRELLLAREAVELGMDENDTLIRRRLAQKMQFVIQDAARMAEPDEAVLREFYETEPEQFAIPARMSFEHIYFTGEDAASRSAISLVTLEQGGDPATMGDRTLLPRTMDGQDAEALDRMFGAGFARQLTESDVGSWNGPVESNYGLHLVRVTSVDTSATPGFEAVRDRVLEAWYVRQQQVADAMYYAELLGKYDVVVDENLKPLLDKQLGPHVLVRSGDAP